jgi:hypothetical protein
MVLVCEPSRTKSEITHFYVVHVAIEMYDGIGGRKHTFYLAESKGNHSSNNPSDGLVIDSQSNVNRPVLVSVMRHRFTSSRCDKTIVSNEIILRKFNIRPCCEFKMLVHTFSNLILSKIHEKKRSKKFLYFIELYNVYYSYLVYILQARVVYIAYIEYLTSCITIRLIETFWIVFFRVFLTKFSVDFSFTQEIVPDLSQFICFGHTYALNCT